jgi:hypothetical protein
MVRDVQVLVEKIKYPADFIVLGCSQDQCWRSRLLVLTRLIDD